MKRKALKLSLFSLFNGKCFCGFIVCCLLLNGFNPKICFEFSNSSYGNMCQIAVKKSVVIVQLFSLPNLSLTIAKKLFKGSCPSADKKSEKKKNQNNSSAEFSIVSFDKRWDSRRSGQINDHMHLFYPGGSLSRDEIPVFRELMNWSQNGNSVYIFLMLLLCFLLLPRSGISEYVIIMILPGKSKFIIQLKNKLDFLFGYICFNDMKNHAVWEA